MNQPQHQTKFSAGADLTCSETVTIAPDTTVLVKTGYYIEHRLEGLVYMLFARSSIAYKKGLLLMNGVGVIDSDYTNEVLVMYRNVTNEDVTLDEGERIAQIVPMNYVLGEYSVKDVERKGGFGSSGTH
jgi:dUTP pyrophosphatase